MSADFSIERDPVFGCELFIGRTTRDGYGRIGREGAHVVRWKRDRGPVPAGMTLDHLCRRRNCTALHHLEPVTKAEQEYRKAWSYRARIAKCPAGHDLTNNAIVTPEGGRVCRACNRIAEQGAETP